MPLETVLHSDRRLIIKLYVPEDDRAQVLIQSTKHGPDLSQPDDVAVVLDGQGVRAEPEDRRHAVAELGDWDALAERGFQLMIRVGEFFEGWDFGPQGDEEQ